MLIHLATGYGVRAETLQAALDGREPAPRHLEDLNTPLVAAFAGAAVDEIIEEMVAARGRVAALIRRLPPDALSREVPHAGRRVVLRQLLLGLSEHDLRHAAELRR